MSMYRTFVSIVVAALFSSVLLSQVREPSKKAAVMTVGVFHFNFPNLDARKIDDKDKIDVLEERYQKQILAVARALKEFRPTKIAVEADPASRKRIDSLLKAYTLGTHSLGRNEIEQLGFRLARELGIATLACVDTWGKHYDHLNYLFSDTSSRAKAFEHYYFHNPDTVHNRKNAGIPLSAEHGIIENLLSMNDPKRIKESLAPYLIGHFKYEEQEHDYTGVDFESGRWFNRNLRIFRNIQRITENASDRILIIYGGGHLNILNYLFECSPEYELVNSEPFLRKAKTINR